MKISDAKPIPGFKNYGITPNGKVYNFKHKRWLKPIKQPHGYLKVDLGHRNSKYIHRLVLETFVGPCLKGLEACHNNGNKSDNRLENLRWDTRQNNNIDKVKHGTHNSPKGENHHRAKLKDKYIHAIRMAYAAGVRQKHLAFIFDVGESEISLIVNRKIWRHI